MSNLNITRFIASMLAMTISINCYLQEKQDYNWIFANKSSGHNGFIVSTKLNFSEGQLIKINDTTNYQLNTTNTAISDSDGNLLFYTNGCQIIQSDHLLMENGDSLNFGKYYKQYRANCSDGYNGFQDVLILNDPSNEKGYYIIHKTINYSEIPFRFYIESLKYTYVDMSYNNGNGKVLKKNVVIHDNTYLCYSYLTAVHHSNGENWWLIQMEEYDNTYYKILINKDGVAVHDSQDIGPKTTINTSAGGFAKFSPDGKKWAWYTTENNLNIFDFDRENGNLSNHKIVNIPHRRNFTGLEFSPNGRFIYISLSDSLVQVDTWKDKFPYELIDVYDGFQNPFSTNFAAMNLAPDCKIYMNSSSSTKSMHVINYPNKKGKSCDFRQHSIDLFYTNGVLNMPNFPRLRVDEEDFCDSVELYTDVIDISLHKANLKIYPNPIIDVAKIEAEASGILYVHDMRGILLKKQNVKEGNNYIDLENYAVGVYFIRFVDERGGEYRGKVFKVKNN